MSVRIGVVNWIVVNVRVPIETLRVEIIGYNRIRTDKLVKIRQVNLRITGSLPIDFAEIIVAT